MEVLLTKEVQELDIWQNGVIWASRSRSICRLFFYFAFFAGSEYEQFTIRVEEEKQREKRGFDEDGRRWSEHPDVKPRGDVGGAPGKVSQYLSPQAKNKQLCHWNLYQGVWNETVPSSKWHIPVNHHSPLHAVENFVLGYMDGHLLSQPNLNSNANPPNHKLLCL